jgi:hypothetical protein
VFVVTLKEHEEPDPLEEPLVEPLPEPLEELLLDDEELVPVPQAEELAVTPVAALKFVLSVE